jgi:hypothetical protein
MQVKKIFLIFMLFLLPLQYTWAMVANYETHNAQDSQPHFGHHDHQNEPDASMNHKANHSDIIDLAVDNEGDTNTQTAKIHDHFGFVHLSCLELLSHDLPNFSPETNQYLNQYTFNYYSPPANTLERPNWIASA